ncbi:hypothetical protein P5V15_009228 [Pogonomyrmex californicus]
MLNVPIFVDLQGFIVREKFIVRGGNIKKKGKKLTYRMFREVIPWNLLTKAEKSKVCWITSNHHGLQWSDSDVAYRLSKPVIRSGVCDRSRDAPRRVYVKGLEKKKWLEEILGCDVIADHDVIVEIIDADFEDIGRLNTLMFVHSTASVTRRIVPWRTCANCTTGSRNDRNVLPNCNVALTIYITY